MSALSTELQLLVVALGIGLAVMMTWERRGGGEGFAFRFASAKEIPEPPAAESLPGSACWLAEDIQLANIRSRASSKGQIVGTTGEHTAIRCLDEAVEAPTRRGGHLLMTPARFDGWTEVLALSGVRGHLYGELLRSSPPVKIRELTQRAIRLQDAGEHGEAFLAWLQSAQLGQEHSLAWEMLPVSLEESVQWRLHAMSDSEEQLTEARARLHCPDGVLQIEHLYGLYLLFLPPHRPRDPLLAFRWLPELQGWYALHVTSSSVLLRAGFYEISDDGRIASIRLSISEQLVGLYEDTTTLRVSLLAALGEEG